MLPLQSVLPQFGPLPEPALAAGLGAATLATTANINGGELFNAALLTVGWDPEALAGALPGTLAFLAILGGWEAGALGVGWRWWGGVGVRAGVGRMVGVGVGVV